jgi:hypothetical protein
MLRPTLTDNQSAPMRSNTKIHKAEIAEQLTRLREGRPHQTPLPNDILITALAGYEAGKFSVAALAIKLNTVEKKILREVSDVSIRRAMRRSVSEKQSAAALMVYGPKPVNVERGTLMGAYSHTLLFKRDECWFLSAIEPAGTTTHMYERIWGRSAQRYRTFAEAQERLSDFWPLFVEARNYLRRNGQSAKPIEYFFSPWADGLLLGGMEKTEGMSEAAPYIVVFKENIGRQDYLVDPYGQNGTRLWAFIRSFIGPSELKPHQAEIFARLTAYRIRYDDVAEHLRLRWKIGVDVEPRYSPEICRVMGFPTLEKGRIDEAMADLVKLVTSDLWLSEAAYSRANRERYKADAERRTQKRV